MIAKGKGGGTGESLSITNIPSSKFTNGFNSTSSRSIAGGRIRRWFVSRRIDSGFSPIDVCADSGFSPISIVSDWECGR